MNVKMIFYTIGWILVILSGLLVIPLILSFCYRDGAELSFVWTILMAFIPGGIMICFPPNKNNKQIGAREGLIIVGLSWILVTIIGAFPFYFSGTIGSYIDSFFETASGWSTTGASVMSNIEGAAKSVMFWRSFNQWVGGMGILVFVLTILPNSTASSLHIMKSEVPGSQVGKIVSKIKVTARILYLIYAVITVVEVILLICGGIGVYDAFVVSFSTMASGGLSVKSANIAGYGSTYVSIVVMIFMFLTAINYNLFYLILIGQAGRAFKNEELRWYLGIILLSVFAIVLNIRHLYSNFGTALLDSFFQVISLITTTGFTTTDYTMWPMFSQAILLFVMFVGGMAGSTGGGFKVSRFAILTKATFKKSRNFISPRDVSVVKMEGKAVEESVLNGIYTFFAVYMAILAFGTIFITIFDGIDIQTSFSGVLTCLGNVGPGIGVLGPGGTFACLSPVSTLFLGIVMLVGRLEIFPILMLFSRRTWQVRKFN